MTSLPESGLATIIARLPKIREELMNEVEKLLEDKHSRNPKYTDEHRDELMAQLYVKARAEMDRLKTEASATVMRMTKWIEMQPAAPHVTHAEREFAWKAIEWQLDKGVTIDIVIEHAAGAAAKGDAAPLRALKEFFPIWAKHGDRLPEGERRDALAKIEKVYADTTPGEAGMAARMSLQLDREQGEVARALKAASQHAERLEASPEREISFARRLADVEANSVGAVRTLRPPMQGRPEHSEPVAPKAGMQLALADDDWL